MPFDLSDGVGAPASEPSPRKRGPSGIAVNCEASRTYYRLVSYGIKTLFISAYCERADSDCDAD